MSSSKHRPQLSRRDLLKAGATGIAASTLGLAATRDASAARPATHWHHDADVVVVGSGAAGAAAALFAHAEGRRVVLIEKAPIFGGTSAKSGGAYWIPNNFHMKNKGLADSEAACLAYMARYSYPHLFKPDHETLGLPASIFRLLKTFYTEASPTIDKLRDMKALESMRYSIFADHVPDQPDYGDVIGETVGLRGRALGPKRPDNELGLGVELMRQLRAALDARGIPVLLSHRAERLIVNGKGEVAGLETTALGDDGQSRQVNLRARRGVVFGTGGYTANRQLRTQFQVNPVFGGCGVPTCEGDFIRIGGALGAQLGNMGGAWRAQTLLEEAIAYRSVPREIWVPPGDSMVLVNRHGRRVVNEKRNYHDRSKVHFTWDPSSANYPNLLMFMVYDQRTADMFAGHPPIPAPGTTESYVLSGNDFDELASALDKRLASLADHTGGFRLAPEFAHELRGTAQRFNTFANAGKDLDFRRGDFAYDRDYMFFYPGPPRTGTGHPANDKSNITMFPLSAKGPYYAVILAPVTLDTNGGPVIDEKSRVLNYDDRPIPGLYGAGNCIASPAHDAYWAAGATLGSALTFGRLAGENAAREPVKEA
ncbi:FAD-dependent oxidoreductase [Burkholderia sp. JSH-S8]|nr:FAD-dependent oxidoreductase [Burkholderia sp. JSH-S8]